VKTEPIAAWEIAKAINSEKRSYASSLGSSLQRAILLAELAALYDDPNLINTFVDRLSKVTAADVQRVARQYLVPTSRTVVVTNPAKPSGDARERQR
jgi:zinc protease